MLSHVMKLLRCFRMTENQFPKCINKLRISFQNLFKPSRKTHYAFEHPVIEVIIMDFHLIKPSRCHQGASINYVSRRRGRGFSQMSNRCYNISLWVNNWQNLAYVVYGCPFITMQFIRDLKDRICERNYFKISIKALEYRNKQIIGYADLAFSRKFHEKINLATCILRAFVPNDF